MFAWPATWSRMIRARANGICELCGAGRLRGYREDDHTVAYWQIPRPEQIILRISYVPAGIAHHILPVRYFPYFAEHPANGIGICGYCHGKIHSGRQWYGWAAADAIHWIDRRYGEPRTNRNFRQAMAMVLSNGQYYDLIHLFGRQDLRGKS